MNTPGKIGPILVVAVLGLASLALLTRAWGETSGAKLTEAAWAVSGGDAPKHGDRLDTGMQGPGGHGRMWRCNAPGGFGPGGMHHHMGWHNPDMIAKRLNAMETEIGIRANQLDKVADMEARFRAHHPGPGSHFDGQSPDDHDPQPNDSPQHGPDQGDRL